MSTTSDITAALRSSDEAEIYSALIAIGKQDLRAHEREVAGFLDHSSARLRSAAIRVLGFYWALPDYRDRAAQLARSEADTDARSVAIMSWCAYYAGTKDPGILRELYAWFSDKSLSRDIREAAYSGMMVVAGIPAAERARALPRGPFDDSIDWDLVRRMLEGTDLVPSDETSLVATLGVRKVIYDYGSATNPTAYFGRIVITFNGETGLVNLVQEHGTKRRAWQAILPAETWRNLIGTLHRYGFPKAPTILEPPVPGSLSKTISWERRGQTESLTIAGRTPEYSDVNRIVWSVVSQIVPGMLRGNPSDWEFPATRIEGPHEIET
jgi:hypothetical protein